MTDEDRDTSSPAGGHVIELESRIRSGAKPRLTVARAPHCFAHHFELDRSTRLVQCTKCKVTLDAFEALVYLAEHWDDFHGNREAIKKELASLGVQRDELKAEIGRLKSAVHRKIRGIAEASPHATKALELTLRIYRAHPRPSSADRQALLGLIKQVEQEAKVVSFDSGAKEGT